MAINKKSLISNSDISSNARKSAPAKLDNTVASSKMATTMRTTKAAALKTTRAAGLKTTKAASLKTTKAANLKTTMTRF